MFWLFITLGWIVLSVVVFNIHLSILLTSSLVFIIVDRHPVMSCRCCCSFVSWLHFKWSKLTLFLSSTCNYFFYFSSILIRWLIKFLYIIKILVLLLWRMTWCSISNTILWILTISVDRRWRSRTSTTITSRSICEILEITWVMSLIIKESLPFKEVLSSLKSTLLLHLLERILVIL